MKRFSKLTPFTLKRDDWHPLVEASVYFEDAWCCMDDRVRALLTFKQLYERDGVDLNTTARQTTMRMPLEKRHASVDSITPTIELRGGHLVAVKFEPGPNDITMCEATIVAGSEAGLNDVLLAVKSRFGAGTSSTPEPVQLDDAVKIKLQSPVRRGTDRKLACNSLEETRIKLSELRIEYNQARRKLLWQKYRNFGAVALIAAVLIALVLRFNSIIVPHDTAQWLAFGALALASGLLYIGVASTFETVTNIMDRSHDFIQFMGSLFFWAWMFIVPGAFVVTLNELGRRQIPKLAALAMQPAPVFWDNCRGLFYDDLSIPVVCATAVSLLTMGLIGLCLEEQKTQRHIAGFWND